MRQFLKDYKGSIIFSTAFWSLGFVGWLVYLAVVQDWEQVNLNGFIFMALGWVFSMCCMFLRFGFTTAERR